MLSALPVLLCLSISVALSLYTLIMVKLDPITSTEAGNGQLKFLVVVLAVLVLAVYGYIVQ